MSEAGAGEAPAAFPSGSLGQTALVLVAVLVLTHLPALLTPGTIQDEAVYVVAARELLHGGKLYIDVIDRKPPLLFYVYAAVLRLFGPANWVGLHLAGVAWVLATMGVLVALGRRLGSVATGVASALLYAVFQPFYEVNNLAFNGEVLMNLPVVIGFWLAFRRSRSQWRLELLAAGAMPALGFLLKQPAGIAGLPLGIYVLLPAYRRSRGLGWRHSLLHALWLCVGFAAAFGAAGLLLDREGILPQAFYWSVLDHDVPYGPLSAVFWHRASFATLIFLVFCAPLVLGTWQSLRSPALWIGRQAERTALLVLLGVSAIGVSASGRFFVYYYIQLLPPLCLIAAPYFAELWDARHRSAGARFMLGWVALSAAVFLVTDLVEMPPRIGTSQAAQYVRRSAHPDDRAFVWGQYPRFYLEAGLRPATRYITFFPLTGYIFGSPYNRDPSHEDTTNRILPGAWQHLMDDFAAHPPRYILDTEQAYYPPKYPIAHFPYLRDLLARDYRLALMLPGGALYERRASAQ